MCWRGGLQSGSVVARQSCRPTSLVQFYHVVHSGLCRPAGVVQFHHVIHSGLRRRCVAACRIQHICTTAGLRLAATAAPRLVRSTPRLHGSRRRRLHQVCDLIAKFHYTGPTGPDPTRQSLGTRVSDKVRGLCLVGSGRARLVECSYYTAGQWSTSVFLVAIHSQTD